jgi:hypothetical protein
MNRLIFALGITPTTPTALSTAAIVPATCVPWWFWSSYQLPEPVGSLCPATLVDWRSSWPRS